MAPWTAPLEPPDPRQNRLLAALPEPVWQAWAPHLELAPLELGQVLHESGQSQHHAYFPTSSIISLLHVLENGDSAEIAVVGLEGMVGMAPLLGGEHMPGRAVVQGAGGSFRMKSASLKGLFEQGGEGQRRLLLHTQALMTQMAQTAVCNRHHLLEQQLCRWLLLSLDRVSGPHLLMTQELIANMLGVRREGVTEAATRLQRLGLIEYARGHITVLDKAGLQARCCECHSVVRQEYDRLLGPG